MSTLRAGIQALVAAPGSVTKAELTALLRANPLETGDTLESEAALLALQSDAVFRSDGGCLYNKEGGPGEDGFREAGNDSLHSASDIGLPATLLSDGSV
jgi:hypothetical protein